MTNEEIRDVAEKSASMAVHQTFRMFGVDTNDQDSVNEFRDDLVFARELRKTTKGAQNKILMVIIGVIVAGAFAAMVKGFGFTPPK